MTPTASSITDQQVIEIVRWAISIGVPALAGLVGVGIGAWLTGRRERAQRRIAFVEQQLKDFYSPMLGVRNEIRMRSELRLQISNTANTIWEETVEEARKVGIEELRKISSIRGPEFKRVIDYDNRQFQKQLLPAYKQMAELFREKLWLADPDTRAHYQHLIEFIELWIRWLAKSIPGDVIDRLEHSEDRLMPFYDHIQQRHDELRTKVQQGTA